MTVTAESFMLAMPAFGASSPDQVAMMIARAYSILDANLWRDQLDYGVTLYVAHTLTVFAKAAKSGGQLTGATTSKSVGGVSVSYDVGSMTHQDAGSWNMTPYGVMFYELVMMFGAGCVQIDGVATGVLDSFL